MDRVATTRIGRWDSTRPLNLVPPAWWPSIEQETTLHDSFNGFPHGDLRPKFASHLDRDIYEHTPAGASEPMGAHEIADTCPRHLSPEHIAKHARCTHHEAIQLADALAVLDADTKLSSEVCRWAFTRGVDATLKYLHPFLVGVAEAETSGPDPQDDEEPVIGFQEIKNLEELTIAELRRECAWREVKAPTRLRRWQLVNLLDRLDRLDQEAKETEPETMGYHTLTDSEECDWIENQPEWFQSLITSVQEADTIGRLKELGKSVFASGLNGNRASVFWSFYNARKIWLERKTVIRPIAHNLTERISNAGRNELAALGKNLYQLQQGAIAGPFINSREWSQIWTVFHQRKEQLALAA